MAVNQVEISLSSSSFDAYRILEDLCSLLEGGTPEFLDIKSLPPSLILELLYRVLVNNDIVFERHPEQAQLLRSKLMPLVMRCLSETHSFALTVRAARIISHILKQYMNSFRDECEAALALLIHLLEPEVVWKRAICMEIFRDLYSDLDLILQMYDLYDGQQNHKNILRDHMAAMVRLVAEKPVLIGVTHQSTLPSGPTLPADVDDTVTLETGVAGVIASGSGNSTSLSVCGISTQWSLVKTPFLEVLDKLDGPSFSETYVYAIVLHCLNALTDSIANQILPLATPDSKTKRKNENHSTQNENVVEMLPSGPSSYEATNPLALRNSHPQLSAIRICVAIIDDCWPAVLAACSTFLNSALDNDFYHGLVRSIQRLAHIAGLLNLNTPRDAFLTTLGKAAVPSDVFNVNNSSSSSFVANKMSSNDISVPTMPNNMEPPIAMSSESTHTSFSTRNLLCFRALLNLAIALGPSLSRDAWFIILETFCLTDLVVGISDMTNSGPSITTEYAQKSDNEREDIPSLKAGAINGATPRASSLAYTSELNSVKAAASKLLQNTSEFSTGAFHSFLTATLGLSEVTEANVPPSAEPSDVLSQESSRSSVSVSRQGGGRVHGGTRSASVVHKKVRMHELELRFVLNKMKLLVNLNINRFVRKEDDHAEECFLVLTKCLIAVTSNDKIDQSLRSFAAELLGDLVYQSVKLSTVTFVNDGDVDLKGKIQSRGLLAMNELVATLYLPKNSSNSTASRAAAFEVHALGLSTLKSLLEECGHSLVSGWDLVFKLISSVFKEKKLSDEELQKFPGGRKFSSPENRNAAPVVRSPRLLRVANSSLHLLASDFIGLLPSDCLLELILAFSLFAAQSCDINISLTSTTAFWDISDFLQSQIEFFSIEKCMDMNTSENDLIDLAKTSDVLISRNSLWMVLLFRMTELSTDPRSEVRNGAIQTALRIVDAYGNQLSGQAWFLCLNKFLFVICESLHDEISKLPQESSNATDVDEKKLWIETTVLTIKGLSTILSEYLQVIVQHEKFPQCWDRFSQCFISITKLGILELDEAVFLNLFDILSQIHDAELFGESPLHSVWSLWVSNPTVSKKPNETFSPELSNQSALQAYLRAFDPIYRLLKPRLTEENINEILHNFRLVVWKSVHPRYMNDIDRSSEVQRMVTDYLKILCREKTYSQAPLVQCMSDFMDSALTKWSTEDDPRLPTFVCFSKEIMGLLSWYFLEYGIVSDILSNDVLPSALHRLIIVIESKYHFRVRDQEPSLWRAATRTSLDILQVTIPYLRGQRSPHSSRPSADAELEESKEAQFWRCVVALSRGIITADYQGELHIARATFHSDEAHDISSFARLKNLIIPSLGESAVPQSVIKDFAITLFITSFIQNPLPSDLPQSRVDDPTKDLCRLRMGRTHDTQPTLRSEMAYYLIDTIFDMSFNSSSCENPESYAAYTRLAASMLPYLLLRCAISLSSYVSDQPLRGLMPQPTFLRKELLYLIRCLTNLSNKSVANNSPEQAKPATSIGAFEVQTLLSENGDQPGTTRKAHIASLYPLILHAVKVAGRSKDDTTVLTALCEVLA